ncbi:hypothetical protein Droror1_Dr00018679 [Drosera rotundifolia]
MSHTLCNFTPSLAAAAAPPAGVKSGSLRCPLRVVRVMANTNNRDNLLQRTVGSSKPQQQRQRQVAPIGLWDRFPTARTVQQMMDTMERVMDDPFAFGVTVPDDSASSGRYARGRTPWEIKEGDKEYKMRFDMPGMTKEDVKVWVEEKMLVLKAEKATKKSGGDGENGAPVDGGDHGDEWSAKSFGRYSCRIALPENVEFEKINAEVKDGVLYVNIPKASSSSKIFDVNVK